MKELAKKLVAAMGEIDAVEKRGKNEKQGYAYVKATDVASTVRAVLVKHGVAFDYTCGDTERWEKTTNSGGTLFFVELKIAVTFTDMETGDSKSVQGVGWGMDSGDKAIYKAMTGALKYAMRMNFLIPDELDPENDSGEGGTKKEIQRSQPKEAQNSHANEFDQHMSQPKPPVPIAGCISEAQGKRFYAIAIGKGRSKQDINNYLGEIGCERTEEMKRGQYDAAIEWAGGKNEQRA